jgi:hypothetical protein
LATYTMEDPTTREPFFVISESRNCPFDLATVGDNHLKRFSEITGFQFTDTNTFESDVKAYGLEPELKLFTEEMIKYHISGAKRRDEIIADRITKEIGSTDAYKTIMATKVPLIKVTGASLSPPFTIAKKLYCPENDTKVFISIDIKSSIFKAYHDMGIIPEDSWTKFMDRFTTSQLLKSNKQFRLKVFGGLNKNKNHSVMINNTIIEVWNKIHEIFTPKLLAIEGDEIVLYSGDDYQTDLDRLTCLGLGTGVRISCFRLEATAEKLIHSDKEITIHYYIRHFVDSANKFDIKCVPKEFASAIYKNAYARINCNDNI